MDKEKVGQIADALGYVIIGAGLVFAFAIGVYWFNFCWGHGCTFSQKSDDWNNFGGYLGGVLNPILSFFSLAVLLLTVVLQARQLSAVKSQAVSDEMQRLLASIAATIDELLRVAVSKDMTDFMRQDFSNKRALLEFLDLASFCTVVSGPSQAQNLAQMHSESRFQSEAKRLLYGELIDLAQEVDGLVWCLDEYTRIGGSCEVVGFYKRRYRPVLDGLKEALMLNADGRRDSEGE